MAPNPEYTLNNYATQELKGPQCRHKFVAKHFWNENQNTVFKRVNRANNALFSYLLHALLEFGTFSLVSRILSISSIFLMTVTILFCVKSDVITKKQNAQNPEYRLYESISWRTKFFVKSVLISRFTIHRWNTMYPSAWHIVNMVPNFDGRKYFRDNGFMHNIFDTMYSGSKAFLNFIIFRVAFLCQLFAASIVSDCEMKLSELAATDNIGSIYDGFLMC